MPEKQGLRAHKTVNPSPVYISGCTAAVNFLSASYFQLLFILKQGAQFQVCDGSHPSHSYVFVLIVIITKLSFFCAVPICQFKLMQIQRALKLVQHSNNPKFAVQICAPYSSLYFVILSPSYSCYPLLSVIQLIKRQSSLSTHLVEIYFSCFL